MSSSCQAAGRPIVRTSSANRGCARSRLKAGRTPIQAHSSGDRSCAASPSQEKGLLRLPEAGVDLGDERRRDVPLAAPLLQLLQDAARAIGLAGQGAGAAEPGAELRGGGGEAARVPDRGERVVGPLHLQVRLAQEEVGHREARVGLQGLLERGRRLHEAPGEVVHEPEARLDGGREAVGFLGEPDLPGRLFEPAHRHEAVHRVPVVRGRVLGVELDGLAEVPLGLRPGPVVDGLDAAEGGVDGGEAGVGLTRAAEVLGRLLEGPGSPSPSPSASPRTGGGSRRRRGARRSRRDRRERGRTPGRWSIASWKYSRLRRRPSSVLLFHS